MFDEKFLKDGWILVDLPNPEPVFEVRALLQKKLEELVGRPRKLEEYHLYAEDDDTHLALQLKLTDYFREEHFGKKIILAQLPFFQQLMGRDLWVQAHNYLRMTRPHKPQDNIGYHRDTFYGTSPFEVSVLVPFVDVPAKSSIAMYSGSHLIEDRAFHTEQIENPDPKVSKGSPKHQLGFLYAPKMMDPSIEEKMEYIPLKVGQALIFALTTIHGSVVNSGSITRWSSDIRLMNAFAPVDLSARPNYYEPLCSSPVTDIARHYEEVNV